MWHIGSVYTVLIVIAIVAQGCVWLLYTYSMEVFPMLTMHMYTIPQTLMSRSGCCTKADGAKSGNQAPNETPSSLSHLGSSEVFFDLPSSCIVQHPVAILGSFKIACLAVLGGYSTASGSLAVSSRGVFISLVLPCGS